MPTNDYIFKRIFGKVGNEDITKSLINSILDTKIENINLDCNPILEKDLKNDKMGILDIKAKLDNNIICNIEMQIANQKNIEKRLLYYWSKLYTSNIKSGENYNKLNKTISILIADFDIESIDKIPKCHTKWELRETEYQKVILTEVLELHIITLPKINFIIRDELKEDLLIWLKFITNPNNIGEVEMEKNELVKKAKEEYEIINKDEYEQYLAHLREKHILDTNSIYSDGVEDGIKQGIEQGIEQGTAKGKKEKAIEIAKKLLKINMSIHEISEITELTPEEIKKL